MINTIGQKHVYKLQIGFSKFFLACKHESCMWDCERNIDDEWREERKCLSYFANFEGYLYASCIIYGMKEIRESDDLILILISIWFSAKYSCKNRNILY